MPDLPRKFRSWQQPKQATAKSIIAQYENGFAGCIYDEESIERLASYGAESGEQVCSALDYEESAAGQLVVPFVHVLEAYPTIYPGPAQLRGDCVAHCSRFAALISLAGDVVSGLPDPVSGHVEEFPEVEPVAEKAGVLCTEPMYHYRGHSGDGWFCASCADTMVRETGAVLRRDYEFVDLTRYNQKYAGKYYKASQIPSEVKSSFNGNLIQDATTCREFEAIRDLLARGLGISSCGGESWSNQRDENGFSTRTSKGWSHAMAYIAADDRPEIHQKYGGPLVLIQNSWGIWNKGGTRILNTDLDIPAGCFWAKWSDCRRRSHTALAGVTGWERQMLPNLRGGFI